MQLQWSFTKYRPEETMRDPIQGEFFATEAIRNPAQALVREGVQSSLDAALPENPVRFRVRLVSADGALPSSKASAYVRRRPLAAY